MNACFDLDRTGRCTEPAFCCRSADNLRRKRSFAAIRSIRMIAAHAPFCCSTRAAERGRAASSETLAAPAKENNMNHQLHTVLAGPRLALCVVGLLSATT